MKRTMVCLTALLMVCGAATAGEWTAAVDTDWSKDGNWSGAHPRTRASGEWIWVEGGNAVGPFSPHVITSDASGGDGTLVVGNGGGPGQLDIDDGGHLTVGQIKICRDGNTGGSSTLSLNATNSELTAAYIVVGDGVDNTATLSTKGKIHAARLYLGGWDAGSAGNGSAQVSVLDGEVWVSEGAQFKIKSDGNANVNITDGKLLLDGDQTALVTALLDGRLTGYGASSNIVIDTTSQPGWTTVTSLPGPTYEYVFFDSFDTADTNDVNADIENRQATGYVKSTYSGILDRVSINNSKLKNIGVAGAVKVDGNLANYIVGEDFEFSFKVSMPDTSGDWSSVHLLSANETIRDTSPIGTMIWGAAQPNAFTLYYGTNYLSITTNALVDAFGSYNKADEHTVQFISTAGVGGTNTYDFVVDGVTIESGLEYAFSENSTRQIGIIGTFADTGEGVFYDDISVRLYVAPTYAAWAEASGLEAGVNDGRGDDPDADTMDNLLEYAMGGNPLTNDVVAIQPFSIFTGADTWEYVYRRRTDAVDRGLTYDLQYDENFDLAVDPGFSTTGGILETGTNSIDSAFDAITNTVPIDTYSAAFLKLEITED